MATTKGESASQRATSAARRRAEIVGVTNDPQRRLNAYRHDLYEFRTDEGVRVRLHDTGLISVELRPIDQTLTLRFDYNDPRWTPPEAVPTPVVVMRFEEVTIHEWEQDPNDGDEPPAETHGQVEDFEYDDGETFRLTTCSFTVEFTASRLTITHEPRH
jgi:hypothetical protein